MESEENPSRCHQYREIFICPMCKGTGFCEKEYSTSTMFVIPACGEHLETRTEFSNSNVTTSTRYDFEERKGLRLPELHCSQPVMMDCKPLQRPVVCRSPKRLDSHQRSFILPPVEMPVTRRSASWLSEMKLKYPPPPFQRRRLSSVSSESHCDSSEVEMLPTPRRFDSPHEVLKTALIRLKMAHWPQVVTAIQDIVQIARFQPELLEDNMHLVNRALCSLLRSLRLQNIRTACQASRELFRTMQNTQRPEFDEIVGSLLHKTADSNRVIRHDANKALDSMVTHVPPFHSVRVLTLKGPSHKNPLVRSAMLRLLTCIVIMTGVDNILSPYSNKDTRRRILTVSAQMLQDGNKETRNFAKQLVKLLMKHQEFDTIFFNEVDWQLREKVEKNLIELKYYTDDSPYCPNMYITT